MRRKTGNFCPWSWKPDSGPENRDSGWEKGEDKERNRNSSNSAWDMEVARTVTVKVD